MTSAGGVAYTWDDNGNLLSDGASTYTYNSANHLIGVSSTSGTYEFTYNGLGDRMQSKVDGLPTSYSLDLVSGLTQVLADSNGNTYLHGFGRIGEEGVAGWQYHHGDALGSVRQLTDSTGSITLSKSYRPYGEVLSSTGSGSSSYGFTGEMTDVTGLIYLRARYMDPTIGRFLTKDVWQGDYASPLSLNRWNYVQANPINFVDPSGKFFCVPGCCEEWVNSALIQLTVYGGPFSHFVVDMFDIMDSYFPMFILFISRDFGAAPLPYLIIMPKRYIDSNLPPSNVQIAHFAHEVVHQTQTIDRYTTWGEAQAYIHSGKIKEELGGIPSSLEENIINLAYDINSPGFTTRDLHKLCEVRKELIGKADTLPYRIFPNLINYLIFPQWYTYCEP